MSVLTTKSYSPCEVIHIEKPFVRVIRHDLWDKVCAGCCDMKKDLKTCTGCKVMKYCGRKCQRDAWQDHKLECPYLKSYTNLTCQPYVQMIGNMILKLKGKDWKNVTSSILGREVSFDDLLSNSEDMIKVSNVDFRQHIEIPLESYIGKENMPDRATVREIFGKMTSNQHGFDVGDPYQERMVYHGTNETEGAGLFIGLSKLDHSCIPNALTDVTGTSVVIRAIRPIAKGEKVTFAYSNMVHFSSANTYKFLKKERFRAECYCSDCSQPYGESKLTKILDMSKAPKLLKETENVLEFISDALLKFPDFKAFVSYRELKNLLKEHDEVLGRTNLRRMQLLEVMCRFTTSKEEKLAGYTELTQCMEEVWGEYYTELLMYYLHLVRLHSELKNERKAKEYRFKVWRLECVIYGKFFYKKWEDALPENQLYTLNEIREF